MTAPPTLPVPVLEHPHWRVRYQPESYDPSRIESLGECVEIVSKNAVLLRGWDFPHFSRRPEEMDLGKSWLAAWSDFGDHLEYWRFYQSTQFLYLGSVRELTDKDWDRKLRSSAHFIDLQDTEAVPGFLSVPNFIYNITEYFEFAARLAQASVYEENVSIWVQLIDAHGFVLAGGEDRLWPHAFTAPGHDLDYDVTLSPADLVASASEAAVECVTWFFDRFGWLNPNMDMIRSDQEKLLKRRF